MTSSPRQLMDLEMMARVGAVVIGWAMIEYALERVLWALVKLPDDHGRILTSRMQWLDKENNIREILADDNSDIAQNIRYSLKALPGLAKERNKIAHGVWVNEQTLGALMITTTRMRPRPTETEFGKKAARPRQRGIFPVEPMTEIQLDDLRNVMLEVGSELMDFADRLEERHSSENET